MPTQPNKHKAEYFRQWRAKRRAPRLAEEQLDGQYRHNGVPDAIDPHLRNPFTATHGSRHAGWTTNAADGSLERGAGPWVLRVRVDDSAPPGGGYAWQCLCWSWVEPVLVELDSGKAPTLRIAKQQAFWAAYLRIQNWLRGLTDDPSL